MVDEAIRTFSTDAELPLYEMAVGDRPFDLGEFDLAMERLVEEVIQGLSEEDIRRIRGDKPNAEPQPTTAQVERYWQQVGNINAPDPDDVWDSQPPMTDEDLQELADQLDPFNNGDSR